MLAVRSQHGIYLSGNELKLFMQHTFKWYNFYLVDQICVIGIEAFKLDEMVDIQNSYAKIVHKISEFEKIKHHRVKNVPPFDNRDVKLQYIVTQL